MNYVNTFIAVAADTDAREGTVPPARKGKMTIAQLEYELIAAKPYQLTQEEVQFAVHVRRAGLGKREVAAQRSALWSEFFSKPIACMRASPLPKSYGWGPPFDARGRVALVGVETAKYKRLREDPSLQQTTAMRRKR